MGRSACCITVEGITDARTSPFAVHWPAFPGHHHALMRKHLPPKGLFSTDQNLKTKPICTPLRYRSLKGSPSSKSYSRWR